jgi:hypothetical protein
MILILLRLAWGGIFGSNLRKKQDFVFGGGGDGDGDGGTSFEITAIWKYETGLRR